MSAERKNFLESLDVQTRRSFLKLAAMAGVSSSVLLSGTSFAVAAGGSKGKADDIKTMNVALGLEHQAIEAYTVGASTKLLSDGVLKVAVGFQSQHKMHRDALASTIKAFGGKPVEPLAKYDIVAVAKGFGINIAAEKDVLMLALKLEDQATKAYLSVIPGLDSAAVVTAASKIMLDEAVHVALLRQALGEDAAPSHLG